MSQPPGRPDKNLFRMHMPRPKLKHRMGSSRSVAFVVLSSALFSFNIHSYYGSVLFVRS